MREPYFYGDFPASLIAERTIQALSALPPRKLLELADSKCISVNEAERFAFQMLTYRNLKWQHLGTYASACNVPLKQLLFGGDVPKCLKFSFFDREALALLKVVPAEQLIAAEQVLRATFPSLKLQIGEATPSRKIISIALLNNRLPESVPDDQQHLYTQDINPILTYFRNARTKERCMLHIDYIADLCAYFKVSPHWAFSLKVPLLCDTEDSDAFFDLFCLLSRTQQIYALSLLLALYPQAESSLDPEDLQCILRVISEEGGVVL